MNTISAPDIIEDTRALGALVREYMDAEVANFNARNNQNLDPADFVAETMEHLPDFLPPKGRFFLAHDAGGALIGMVCWKGIGPGKGEVKRLYVTPAARGAGVAHGLMDALIERAQKEGLSTLLMDVGRHLTGACLLYTSPSPRDS